jgi:Holliday junction resolvase RusA-like endonuclease
MITNETVFTVVVPEWINKVRIGTIKTTYFVKGDKLPEEHQGAKTRKIGKKLYYIDSKNKKIVKNPTKRGQPEYWNVNGQAFYSNNMTWKERSTIVNFYHKYFSKYVNEQLKQQFPSFLAYKLDMKLTMYETYSRHTPDVTNMWILAKMMEDTIVKAGILRDDSPQFRMFTTYGYQFVEKEEDRKLVLEFKYNKY